MKPILRYKWMYGIIGMLVIVLGLGTSYAKAYSVSSDPMRIKQTYLDQIHMDQAWPEAGMSEEPLIVAVVDTGVDLDHPDLEGRLVPGTNLLNPQAKPMDDNGHGTNVAGVIAAKMNNDKGIAGIAPNARIMPIKALEADGTGGETKLGEGIRYAVDHGAKIVVLSLGLNKYSSYMAGTVRYAEERGVLLVAASGNEGGSVKYPAAYPTVLAVGGMTAGRQADVRSNYGPDLDLVAPWSVYTTARGGGYENKEGTSMAAPQVAGAAALLWGKFSYLEPWQVREMIKQTAEDLGQTGWDAATGYGLLRADRLLKESLLGDRFEPNDERNQARMLPVHTMVHADFSSGADIDWYKIDSPYDGYVKLVVKSSDASPVSIRHIQDNKEAEDVFITDPKSRTVTLPVKKGINEISLRLSDPNEVQPITYSVQTEFLIYSDAFEDNDKQYKASALPARSQVVKGTFHQENDQDWFVISFDKSGTLRLKTSVDTARIDPVVLIQKKGEKSTTFDQFGEGTTEVTSLLNIMPGEYYIRISNVKDNTQPVMGEYTLEVDYTPKLIDPNEPNDKPYQAATLALHVDHPGVIDSARDVDWFQFTLEQESLVQLNLRLPQFGGDASFKLYDHALGGIGSESTKGMAGNFILERRLPAGLYYIKLQSEQTATEIMYELNASTMPLVAGFSDIHGHWAENAIADLARDQVVGGGESYRFEPDQPITRAEAAVMLSNGFRLERIKPAEYPDVSKSHWAYHAIAKTTLAGYMDGYEDGHFRPDQPLTRMEMTRVLANAMGMAGKYRGRSPYRDVADDYWGVGILKQMALDNWIRGFPDGTYRPDVKATRAEFAALLSRFTHSVGKKR
ncbi:S8 family serine peptidase [Paenibacillus sp. FJAT-26967]|uniref:S8 family peptidase n=1 Tax=Paenibacillus sp. FJAT-26967 TaxID=1729690 RepID=UPI000838D251|nr:S8 family serine peptidase [Paenibacillus sp. FJAT-26967]